ncbi:MAG: tRNA-uridine aminocarboxypropyltransferase [Campylobacterota bacterium]|nr:tRNA-uridine aminocarboxypropyltransferase [Campylobacterota bacterium]
MKSTKRTLCYDCYRPKTSCMCSFITPIKTNTRFVILMHPKEYRKTKNGTGHFTHLSLTHCELHVGIDFTEHTAINAIINDPSNLCYTLYPHENSINLNEASIGEAKKNTVIFLIDSTWPCSRAMLKASPNIDALQKVSFTPTKHSAFTFKEQPKAYCLSTMESTLCLLELLNSHKVETIPPQDLKNFLLPFEKMVAYQMNYT